MSSLHDFVPSETLKLFHVFARPTEAVVPSYEAHLPFTCSYVRSLPKSGRARTRAPVTCPDDKCRITVHEHPATKTCHTHVTRMSHNFPFEHEPTTDTCKSVQVRIAQTRLVKARRSYAGLSTMLKGSRRALNDRANMSNCLLGPSG